VVPSRPVARLSELKGDELSCLMQSVQSVGSVVERAYNADALTFACQDGKAAGQSVPHVHFHIIPRKLKGDRFSGEKNDEVYPALEKAEGELADALVTKESSPAGEALRMDNEGRKPRTMEEMEKEAQWLSGFF
jgi:bis(5'-adenosyl)-triphosphatase